MIEFCTDNLEFSTLLKIDVTTVMSRMDGPEYEGRLAMDQESLAQFLREVDLGHDYAGFMCHERADRSGAEGWAAKKGGVIDYSLLFGDGPMPPFFSGKCYLLSRRFAAYVARYGAEMADEQREHFLGSEDVMIGRLFQRFERGTASVRNYGGLGLGLYLIQEIVQAHGGSVAAENAEGGGARFRVRLPIVLTETN